MLRVDPISNVAIMRNPPKRALMSVRMWGNEKTEHTVTDTKIGERHTLPEVKAWELYNRLNIEV